MSSVRLYFRRRLTDEELDAMFAFEENEDKTDKKAQLILELIYALVGREPIESYK